MEPWYKIVDPRKEVRAGRSFNPDELPSPLNKSFEVPHPKTIGTR
jgi:hypothetical protein